MGGKTYFCDYCECFMKNDVNVRKKHNSGLPHTICKYTYLRQFEDPRKILAEESAKLPCYHHFRRHYCKFDLFCQNTHFSPEQLEQLQNIGMNCICSVARVKFVC